MPAATCKTDLIAVTMREFERLTRQLDEIDAAQALVADESGISIKDIVGHRAHWISLFLGWYVDGQSGREVHFPAPGYKWNQLPAYSAVIRSRQRGLGWLEARALLAEYHAQLLAFLQVRDEAELYGGPMKGARNDWTTGRWAEAAGASHYRSAAKTARAMLKVNA
ncbi:ClbS/DfsB family four-helix bundle protein [Tropicimonas sp. TH_r6]|uniref:ClbS/DfsB family four-helix bundle protein n=1 Tax=Tropicimonas sp. TH_r6 TaxID=3082085 RepID=UPI002952D966|nr:ClbS/DfsB family four-helix bundle protein [Tropicimonas sp. TH_r6]MDV7142512.1 ClbS/DfsB family four-helix bundle protein [Tropicimonas sp. TH_r6]